MAEKKDSNKKLTVGDRVGHWIITGEMQRRGKATIFPCRCVCGKERSVPAISSWNGQSTSCGCVENSADSVKGEKGIPIHAQAILDLISQGKLPPADGWAVKGHEPTWNLGSLAKIIGVSEENLLNVLMREEARFSLD